MIDGRLQLIQFGIDAVARRRCCAIRPTKRRATERRRSPRNSRALPVVNIEVHGWHVFETEPHAIGGRRGNVDQQNAFEATDIDLWSGKHSLEHLIKY